jgi:hypothetical protein
VNRLKSLFLSKNRWWSYYQKNKGELRESVKENVLKMLTCGTLVRGYATHRCEKEGCGHEKKVCFSCNSRFCPACGKRATDQWIQKQIEVLPDTEWQHLTFTQPDELWELFDRNRFLLKELSRIAGSILTRYGKKKGVLIGAFIALHTFGRDLKWNVHIHVSATCGGITLDLKSWKKIYFAQKPIAAEWKYEVITLLRDYYDQLTLPKEIKEATDFNHFLDEQYQKDWYIHFAKSSPDVNHTVAYLGRYLKRPAISQSRLKHYDGNHVRFEYLDHYTNTHQEAEYDWNAFFDRLLKHIPEKNFRLINYYGFLSNRLRGEYLPIVYKLLNQTIRVVKKIRWRQLCLWSQHVDPLKCILCGSQMKWVGLTLGKSFRELKRYHKEIALCKILR